MRWLIASRAKNRHNLTRKPVRNVVGNPQRHGGVNGVQNTMWLHLPEMSINLAQVLRIIPLQDGKLQIVQPDNITVTVDGMNAAAVAGLLATQPGGHLDSWLGKRVNLNRPAGPAPEAGAAPPAAAE